MGRYSAAALTNIVRFVCERKKLVILCVFISLILTQFVYTSRWQLRTVITRPVVVGSMLVDMWNRPTRDTNEEDRLLTHIRVERQEISVAERRLKTVGDRKLPLIAIGSGITSKKLPPVNHVNVATVFQFFNTFLPTFCHTADRVHFNYAFYLAFDGTDRFFSNKSLADAFRRTFLTEIERLCSGSPSASLTLVSCDHAGKPAWAQNDAMLAAYVDGADFFYRVNDDTKMMTGDWARQFVAVLDGYNPPRVGVVGPNHRGGNTGILTYDFVHRTHVDLFGFYYPRLFTDWWGDGWITRVYRPNRSTKLEKVRLAHTMSLGQRYRVNWSVGKQLDKQLIHDKIIINRYINALKAGKLARKRSGRKVISMSLYGSERRYTWGAIRNAQLLPVYLPDWTLRIYIPEIAAAASSSLDSPSAVHPAVVNTLRTLGAEIAWIKLEENDTLGQLSPRDWRLLAADDSNIDFLLIRDADHRLTDRESTSIDEWIAAAESSGSDNVVAIHCFRDHPKHAIRALTDGLWGGRPAALRRRLNFTSSSSSLAQLVTKLKSPIGTTESNKDTAASAVLNGVVWPAMKDQTFCHDSVSACGQWPPLSSRHVFRPTITETAAAAAAGPRDVYVGQKFDAHEVPLNADWKELDEEVDCDELLLITVKKMKTVTSVELPDNISALSTGHKTSSVAAAAASSALIPLSTTTVVQSSTSVSRKKT